MEVTMVTIREILKLDNFRCFDLIAGKGGLDRIVLNGGFIDHEEPLDLEGNVLLNEMVFTNLPMIKGKPEEIINYIRALIDSRTSCLAIKKTLFSEIPKDAIELADKYDYPVFLFDDVFIDKLILDIDELVNNRSLLSRQFTILDELENHSLSPDKINSLTLELNRYFKKHLKVCMLKKREGSNARFDIKIAKQIFGKHDYVNVYNNLIIFILSSDTSSIDENIYIKQLNLNEDDYLIGISSISNNLKVLIGESKTALKYACFNNQYITKYDSIGIYKILFSIYDEAVAHDFYSHILDIIIDHDNINQSELLKTLIAYIKSDGDIKETSRILFQHENTVRYRLRKIKNLLDPFSVKYESLAIAVHLYEMNEKRADFEFL